MKRLIALGLSALFAVIGYQLPAIGDEAGNTFEGERVAANQLIVSVDKGATEAEIAELFSDSARSYEPISSLDQRTFLVSTRLYSSIAEQIAFFEASEIVRFAEPNGFVSVGATSNDPLVLDETLWGMSAVSGSVARGAWEAGYTGSNQVYVAVIDSGIDVSHPDLAANIWVNAEEIPGNGIDDDGNGFVDDVNGYDFVNKDGSVFDENENYHGTHVAGTIAAVGGNGIGVAGVSWNTKLISAKIINSNGGATYSDAIAAIDYVTMLRTQKGLDIIASNNSWGGSGYSRSMEEAIQRGGDAGIIFVAAAGNDRNNNDGDGHNPVETYPASYECSTPDRPWDCVVSVGAHNKDGSLAFFSSYGANTVDLLAPGVDIVSTMPGGLYETADGTSMAAPHVTGALALCVGANRGMSAFGAIDLLKSTVTVDAALSQTVETSGRLNALDLATGCDVASTSFSGAPTFHIANATYTDRIRLDWQDSVAGEYEYEIQIAIGPAGCSASADWQHHAWIGPGLTSYPAINLDEAEFHCFRMRAWKDSQATAWLNSNVSITWTSNLPFIYGQVLTQDGTTVSNIPVRWLASGSSTLNAIKTVTNASGEYVLQVPNGVSGELYVETSRYPSRSTPTVPLTPWGLTVGGKLTVAQDTTVDLTLPPLDYLNISVIEADSLDPVEGATIGYTGLPFRRCLSFENSDYRLFPGAEKPDLNLGRCFEFAVGSSSFPETDANGEVRIAIVDAALIDPQYTLGLEARHPINTARVKQQEIDVSAVDGEADIVLALDGDVEITGQVLTQDGTTVSNIPVRWLASGSSTLNAIKTVTNASGEYVLQVPNGVSGELYVETSRYPSRSTPTVPLTPWGLTVGGKLTVAQDTTVDLTLPPLDYLNISVIEADSLDPVEGATIGYTGLPFRRCLSFENSDYRLFPGAEKPDLNLGRCFEFAVGSSSFPETDANGEVRIAIVDAALIDPQYTLGLEARHPLDTARVRQATVSVQEISGATDLEFILPGTPSKPEQPTAMADEGSVTLTWTEPWNGGAYIDYYKVWVSRSAEGPFEQVTTGTCAGEIDPTWRSCEVTGLEGGVPYFFAIIAHNEVGYSDLSISTMAVPLRTILDLLLTPTPTISGTAQVGQTLTADSGTWDSGVSLDYRWLRDGEAIPEASSSTYVLTEEDEGALISVRVTGSKDGYNSVRTLSAVTSSVAERPLVDFSSIGTPTITGTVQVGETLTVQKGSWDVGADLSYQWYGDDVALPGATTPSLQLLDIHQGMTIKVEVSATKAGHNPATSLSAGTAAVAAIPVVLSDFSLTPTPVVEGAAMVGEWLSATIGDWDQGANLSYAWHRNGQPITGATGLDYQISINDLFGELTFVVSATKDGFNPITVSSLEITNIISPEPEPEMPVLQQQATPAAPTIAGSARVGSTLFAELGLSSQSVTVIEYQWLKDDIAIFGATQSSYVPAVADEGSMLSLRVTSKRDGYLDATVTSEEVGPVLTPVTAGPTIIGGGGGFTPVIATPVIPLTSNPIAAGQAMGAVDASGKAIEITPLLALDKKSIELSFGVAKLELSAASGASFSDQGKLSISPNAGLEIAASGYKPDSTVTGYLVPTANLIASMFRIASEEIVEIGTVTVLQDGSFVFNANIKAAPGSYILQLTGTTSNGTVTTIAIETLVAGDQSMKTWAKRLPGNTEAKLYAKNIVRAGKVSFRVNGKEIAWIRAVDESDPKLRVVTEGPMTGANYLVRTVKLQKGKNVLEVYIDGERTTRVAYSRK